MELPGQPPLDLSIRTDQKLNCMDHNSEDTAPVLGIVVPCYNEEKVLPEITQRLQKLLDDMTRSKLIAPTSSIWFVDDGSVDSTWRLISSSSRQNERIRGIKLSRNHGHQNALLAGLQTAQGDALVSVDADLQDDISVIKDMVVEYNAGKDVVYGVRNSRTTDSWLKRVTAEAYYYLLAWLGVEIVFNHADFRLLSRRGLDTLSNFNEVNLFLRGIIPIIGFPSSVVMYSRSKRYAGESKYPLRKMLALAVDGITSHSVVPLRVISALGFMIFLVSVILSVWVLWAKLISGDVVPGWASSVLPMYLLGGIQLLSLGVIGEYISKIYMETKKRPRFIIEEVV